MANDNISGVPSLMIGSMTLDENPHQEIPVGSLVSAQDSARLDVSTATLTSTISTSNGLSDFLQTSTDGLPVLEQPATRRGDETLNLPMVEIVKVMNATKKARNANNSVRGKSTAATTKGKKSKKRTEETARKNTKDASGSAAKRKRDAHEEDPEDGNITESEPLAQRPEDAIVHSSIPGKEIAIASSSTSKKMKISEEVGSSAVSKKKQLGKNETSSDRSSHNQGNVLAYTEEEPRVNESLPIIQVTASKTARTRTQRRPKIFHMVNDALGMSKSKGRNLSEIKSYMSDNYGVDAERMTPTIQRYLSAAVAEGSVLKFAGKVKPTANGNKRKPVLRKETRKSQIPVKSDRVLRGSRSEPKKLKMSDSKKKNRKREELD